jgi:hypothetical protein
MRVEVIDPKKTAMIVVDMQNDFGIVTSYSERTCLLHDIKYL